MRRVQGGAEGIGRAEGDKEEKMGHTIQEVREQ